MKREPCKICGSEDGPAVFAADETCSEYCRKLAIGEISVEKFEQITGKKVISR